jgi:hypothetical protein
MIAVAQKGVMKKVKDERGRNKNQKLYRMLDSIENLLIAVVIVKRLFYLHTKLWVVDDRSTAPKVWKPKISIVW